MKRLIVDAGGSVRLRDGSVPAPQPGQVHVRASCSLISPGTELHYIEQARFAAREMPLGYCSSGVVERVGEGVEGVAAGDRVIAMGWGYAVHAEHVCVPKRLCIPVQPATPLHAAVFANLGATAVHAVHRGRVKAGDRVLVVGAGLVGQLLAQLARAAGASVWIGDRVQGRLSIAEATGISARLDLAHGALVDVARDQGLSEVFDTVFMCIQGDATALVAGAVSLLARAPDGQRQGSIVGVGRFSAEIPFSVELGNVDFRYSARCGAGYRDDEYMHGRRDYGAPPGEDTVQNNLRAALAAIELGRLRVAPLLTHQIDFSTAPDAYSLFANPGATLGVAFLYQP